MTELKVSLIVLIAIVCFACLTSMLECHSKANALGYKCSWGWFQDCVVTKPNGSKALLQQLRDFEK